MPTVFLIDASIYVFRAYFSLPDTVLDDAGRPANAVLGFGSFLCDLLQRQRPEHLALMFDESLTTSFRNDIYPAYKANRPPPPADLQRQFAVCRGLVEAMGILALGSPRYEADDLIGSLARRVRADQVRMIYVTADKDLAQLVEDEDRWWDPARDRWLDEVGVFGVFGVRPSQIADLLGLAGDAVDNVPGVPGIGRKTAATLLGHFGDMDGLYADLDRVGSLPLRGAARVRRLLADNREQALLCRDLATINREAPLPHELHDLRWRGVDVEALRALRLPEGLRWRAERQSPEG